MGRLFGMKCPSSLLVRKPVVFSYNVQRETLIHAGTPGPLVHFQCEAEAGGKAGLHLSLPAREATERFQRAVVPVKVWKETDPHVSFRRAPLRLFLRR